MRLIRAIPALILIISLLSTGSVRAETASLPPAEPSDSPLRVSAYSIELLKNGTNYYETPRYVELYNDSDTPVNPAEYTLRITDTQGTIFADRSLFVKTVPGYVAPGGFIVIDFDDAVTGEQYDGMFTASTTEFTQKPTLTREIQLFHGGVGVYAKDITLKNPDTTIQAPTRLVHMTVTAEEQAAEDGAVYDSPLYQPRNSFPLAPIEILANPKVCSPMDVATDCREYIEFYNPPGNDEVRFDGTRLRVGYLGQQSTATNTTVLQGLLKPGQYAIFEIPITNSGGYVWLEDTYGLLPFENTVVAYPDASSTTHKGQSWTLISGVWQWGQPSPASPNIVLPEEVEFVPTQSGLEPCASNQYRNPLTNRCKLRSSSTSLQPCASNQYRSPETNRCRSVSSASSSTLTPCRANQYRNPETNRCKSLSTAASTLKPCAANQERNPLTNRCRKLASTTIPTADFPVTKDAAAPGTVSVGWLAFTGVGVLALGYGAWEWRDELVRMCRRVAGFVRLK